MNCKLKKISGFLQKNSCKYLFQMAEKEGLFFDGEAAFAGVGRQRGGGYVADFGEMGIGGGNDKAANAFDGQHRTGFAEGNAEAGVQTMEHFAFEAVVGTAGIADARQNNLYRGGRGIARSRREDRGQA